MRRLLAFLLFISITSVCEAKEMRIPIGTKNVNQLHDELLAAFPSWNGVKQSDGLFHNPQLRVESTDKEIILNFPDGTNQSSVDAVISAHVSDPNWKKKNEPSEIKSLRQKLQSSGFTEKEIEILIR